MRRRADDWINATHILKAAGFDKPARTRILEREVQKETHEKVQGGYGKYQGPDYSSLRKGISDIGKAHGFPSSKVRLWRNAIPSTRSFVPSSSISQAMTVHHQLQSTPPTSQRFRRNLRSQNGVTVSQQQLDVGDSTDRSDKVSSRVHDDYDNISAQLNDDDSIPDDTTVASASFMGDDERYDMSQPSTGHRKRKREEQAQNAIEQAHVVYADELLDYFMLSNENSNAQKPEPPLNFQPDWIIDSEGHTSMHWAAAMGDVDVMKQLKRFGANLAAPNGKGETPLMRCVLFTNCLDKQTMPGVVKELIPTIESVDLCNSTALHHAAAVTATRQKHQCARYYLDIILNKMQEIFEPDRVRRILDAQDINGNTAIHIAAQNKARKCVRALMGRGASTDILNNNQVTAEDLIQELNAKPKHGALRCGLLLTIRARLTSWPPFQRSPRRGYYSTPTLPHL